MSRRATTLAVRGALRAFAWLPLPVNHALGAAIGRAASVWPGRLRRVTETNIARCFPELGSDERRALVRRSLVETGKTLTESGPLWFWPGERVLDLVQAVSGEAEVDAARARGRGVVFAAPHLGAWELLGLYVALRHGPLTSLYRPPRLEALERTITEARERSGARLVPTDPHGIRALFRALERGETVGILPDQEPKRGTGVFAPFFGIPAHTMVLISRLAARSGAAVFLAYAERLPHGRGYHVRFVRAPAGVDAADGEAAAAALNRGIETCVRQHPEQYQWTYKRFGKRPPGEPDFY